MVELTHSRTSPRIPAANQVSRRGNEMAYRRWRNPRCVACGNTFKCARADADFCSHKCRQKAYRCRQAGKPERSPAADALAESLKSAHNLPSPPAWVPAQGEHVNGKAAAKPKARAGTKARAAALALAAAKGKACAKGKKWEKPKASKAAQPARKGRKPAKAGR